jgi:hypothetical protein
MVQSTLWAVAEGVQINPTQSGGADCPPPSEDYGKDKRWAGSPILSTTLDTGAYPQSLTTLLRPLNFCHDTFGDALSPEVWKGYFRITVNLGCGIAGQDSDEVVKIRFEAQVGSDLDPEFSYTYPEGSTYLRNTGWFKTAVFGDCQFPERRPKVRIVDLRTGMYVLIPSPFSLKCDALGQRRHDFDKGIMVVDQAGQFAIGLARLVEAYYNVWAKCGYACDDVHQQLILTADGYHELSNSSLASEEVFWVFGPPDVVRQRLHEIWVDGGDCDDQ